MSTTYHCDRCGLGAVPETGRHVYIDKLALGQEFDRSTASEVTFRDLCGDCVALSAAFLEPVPSESLRNAKITEKS